jgi:DNA-binding transcriptional LysR family regulator
MSEGKDLGVFSSRTWRLSDLGAKHAFLMAGLGWGGMPLDVIEGDLASGALVPLALEGLDTNLWMAMSAIYRTDSPPGPAGRWLIDRLKRTADERMPDGPPARPEACCRIAPVADA